jgi:undecaprenyl-diphosphatase
MNNLIKAIVYGVIQGLTEFIPISSTAHIRVIPALLKWGDPGAAFTAVIQIGTLVATLIYFRQDIFFMLSGFFNALRTRKFFEDPYSRMFILIMVGTIPISIFGLTLKKFIEGDARGLYVVSCSLIGLAVILLIAEKISSKKKEFTEITVKDGLWIGLAQAIALIPGSSRSGVTITAGLFCGLKRDVTARFSFLLSIPAVGLSGLYELYSERHELLNENAMSLVIATLVSGIVGYFAIAFLINYLKTRSNLIFIIYRILLGVAIIILLSMGVLHNI